MMEIISFIAENDLLIEGVLTLASVALPALIPLAHVFRSRGQIINILNGMDTPNHEIIQNAKGKVSNGVLKLLNKKLAEAEYNEYRASLKGGQNED